MSDGVKYNREEKIEHDYRRQVGGADGLVGQGILMHVNRKGKCPWRCWLLKRDLDQEDSQAHTYPGRVAFLVEVGQVQSSWPLKLEGRIAGGWQRKISKMGSCSGWIFWGGILCKVVILNRVEETTGREEEIHYWESRRLILTYTQRMQTFTKEV